MKVTQLANKNQFCISDGDTDTFQSYDSIIAKVTNGAVTLDPNFWAYSVTTLKHLKIFLGVTFSKKEIQAKIDNGEYKTADLN